MKKSILWIVGIVAILSVFLLQSKSSNFRAGHRGWVAAHCLAIADKATSENRYLGNTCNYILDGKKDYYYFDRYPVFFAAISNVLLSGTKDLSKKVYYSRQLMNVIYVVTFITAFLLARLIFFDSILAMSATLLISSGFYYVKYKDMFHFDQPALLGLVIFLYVFKLRELKKIKLPLMILLTVAGSLMGRGYATCLAVAAWFFLDHIIWLKKEGARKVFTTFYKRDSFLTVLFVFIFSSSALFYNVHTESVKRNIGLKETSIVGTAKHRTGMTKAYSFPWPSFIKGQSSRIMKGSFPFAVNAARKNKTFVGHKESFRNSVFHKSIITLSLLAYLIALFLIFKLNWKNGFKERVKRELNFSNFIIFASGAFWLFPMKRLAGPHHYTTMYYIGLYYILLFLLLKVIKKEKFKYIFLALSSVIFLSSQVSAKLFYDGEEAYGRNYTKDFNIIRNKLDKDKVDVISLDRSDRKVVTGSPYALCFYIGERYISKEKTKYYIGTEKSLMNYENLTPDNKFYFLQKAK